jgi:hypothetical protein
MEDGVELRLAEVRAACDSAKWKLLTHATSAGVFFATEAPRIAGLPEKSGNARTTHADGLCEVGLLEREVEPHVHYRATDRGRVVQSALAKLIADGDREDEAEPQSLARGEHVDLVATPGKQLSKPAEAVIFRISRRK